MKNQLLYATRKGQNVYPFIIRENTHSNEIAMIGFSEEEVIRLGNMLERVNKNISRDWKYVKKDTNESIKL
ncbi:hypothetical protein [Staphylococcus sp. NAM3COL9]|uniref:hypothetical protein n=1 Tax=Staphylococcus sp. NAM3COL9 TaxID=1667172 RepID=UPI00155F3441|nr:hypothetical protein [Staphylococcus sp. NAM3COL9]